MEKKIKIGVGLLVIVIGIISISIFVAHFDQTPTAKGQIEQKSDELKEKIYGLQFEGYQISWDAISYGVKARETYEARDYNSCMDYLIKMGNSLNQSKKWKQYPFPTNVTKEDYWELGNEILDNALKHIEVGEKDGVPVYQIHPLFCGPLYCGHEDNGEEERMASAIAIYIKITGNTTLDDKDLLEYIRGLSNYALSSKSHLAGTPLPALFVTDLLYMFGEDLNENILWNRLTTKEKQAWMDVLQAQGGWNIPNNNFNSFAAVESYMAYRLGFVDGMDKSDYYIDEMLRYYTNNNWLRDRDGFTIYSYWVAGFLSSLNDKRKTNSDPAHREDEIREIVDTHLEFVKYAARDTGDVWTFGRHADSYGEATFTGLESAANSAMNEEEKGIFKRIAHLTFLMCRDRYFNETYGLLNPWQSPPRTYHPWNTDENWGNVNAHFLITLFGAYAVANDSISESRLPSETMDYERFFPFDDTEGACIYNKVGEGHITVLNVEGCEKSSINKTEVVNTLEYWRQKGFSGEMEAANYVILKTWLQSEIDNKQEIIGYLDGKQREDGMWDPLDGSRPKAAMFISWAYSALNATPENVVDMRDFLKQYDTWEEVLPYREIGSKYHLVSCWVEGYRTLPPWMPELFEYYESNLGWTTSEEMHTRTHILYCYMMAERPFPNPDGIINATLQQQRKDGTWVDPGFPNALHETAIQLAFLDTLEQLYPDSSTKFQVARDKAKPYIVSCYKTTVKEGKTLGYFVDYKTGEDTFFFGVLAAVSADLITGDTNSL